MDWLVASPVGQTLVYRDTSSLLVSSLHTHTRSQLEIMLTQTEGKDDHLLAWQH